MKTKRLWINLISHEQKRKWRWKPTISRAQIIYSMGNQAYLSPLWEFTWLFVVFQWTNYNLKQEYNTVHVIHECDSDLIRERMIELESAIRKHRDEVGDSLSMNVDRELWKVLRG